MGMGGTWITVEYGVLIGKCVRLEKSPSAVMNENQLMQDSAVTNSEQTFVLVVEPRVWCTTELS